MLGLLVISASAPPVGGAGTIRMAKFVKYLPEFGYQPVIVSLDKGYFKRAYIDESLLDDVREATIYRLSPSIDNISSIGKPLRNLRYLRLAKKAFRENRIDIIFSTHPLPTALNKDYLEEDISYCKELPYPLLGQENLTYHPLRPRIFLQHPWQHRLSGLSMRLLLLHS